MIHRSCLIADLIITISAFCFAMVTLVYSSIPIFSTSEQIPQCAACFTASIIHVVCTTSITAILIYRLARGLFSVPRVCGPPIDGEPFNRISFDHYRTWRNMAIVAGVNFALSLAIVILMSHNGMHQSKKFFAFNVVNMVSLSLWTTSYIVTPILYIG